MSESSITQQEADGRADFGFYVGTWKVHNWRLRETLKGSDEWEEFEGVSVAHMILGGLGNMEEITLERPSGQTQEITLRLFDPQSRQWSLYWAGSGGGWNWSLPMIGSFKDGRGEFYCHEPIGGRHIFTRYVWSDITATSCHWEQACRVWSRRYPCPSVVSSFLWEGV